MPIEAVTFDFWNTIAREPPGTMGEAREAAIRPPASRAATRSRRSGCGRAWPRSGGGHQASWAQGLHFPPRQAAEVLVAALGLEGAARETIAEAFLTAGRGAELALAPEIGPTLERLRADGVRAGDRLRRGLHRRRDPARVPRPRRAARALLRLGLLRRGRRLQAGAARSSKRRSRRSAPSRSPPSISATCAAPTSPAPARSGCAASAIAALADDPDPGAEADFVLDDHRDLPPLVATLG